MTACPSQQSTAPAAWLPEHLQPMLSNPWWEMPGEMPGVSTSPVRNTLISDILPRFPHTGWGVLPQRPRCESKTFVISSLVSLGGIKKKTEKTNFNLKIV
jgi:hypothetical protein